MTARSTWKGYELRIATDLHGARIPVTGIDRNGADVVTPDFHVQVKLRRSLPAWIFTWLDGIRSTTPMGKTGILVLRIPRMRDDDGLVVLRYADFVALHTHTVARDNQGVIMEGP